MKRKKAFWWVALTGLVVIGFSNGLATRAEEELFILNNFGGEYVYTLDLEPMPEEEEQKEDVNTNTEE